MAIAVLASVAPTAVGAVGDISTVAGNGVSGYWGDGGPATSAQMIAPAGVAFGSGGDLFIADFYTHTVRKVMPGGVITTLAGTSVAGYSGDGGPATSAQLDQPGDVVTDAAGNVYIADFRSSRVRRIAPDGTITTFAGTGTFGYSGDGGQAAMAQLGNPAGLDIDPAGNLYVADFGTHTVRRITPAGVISTIAGNGVAGYSGDGGPATFASMYSPGDVAVDGAGNAFIPEFYGHRVRKVTPGGIISTVAGTGVQGYSGTGGPATSAQLSNAAGVDVDSSGNLFVAEFGNHVIRKVTPSGTITLVAGTASPGFSGDGGPAASAQLYSPSRVTLNPDGDFYISDWSNHRVRFVDNLGSPDAPILTTTSPASPESSNSPRVIGSSQPGWMVRLYTNSTCTSSVVATGTAEELASPGLNVTVPDDSTTTFYATATSLGGSVSGCSTSSITYVEDSTPPVAPQVDANPASPGNDATPTWAFSAEAGATLECRLERGATVISNWTVCTSPKTHDLTAQPDGAYTFSVRARDAAGNTGPAATSSYTLDTTVPPAPQIDSSPASPGNDATPTWTFPAEAGATIECRLERGTTVISDWTACTSPKTYELSSQPDDAYTFAVRARDAAGNTGPAAKSNYTLDTTAPAASIDSSPASQGTDATPTWTFSAEAGATFECRLTRSGAVVSDWVGCASSRTFDLTAQPDGAYTFSVRARDAAGNTGAAATSNYTLDTTAPAASIDSSPASQGTDATPTWTFSAEAGATFECRLTRSGAVVSDWVGCASSRTFDLTAQPDGAYTFSVRARDAAGNTGAAATSNYTLDTTAPAAPAASIDSSPASQGTDATPTWTFTAEAGATFECRLERGATVISDWTACTSPRTIDLSGQPDATYTLSVRARDAAGNTGPATTSDYTLDTSVPAAPRRDSSPASPGNDPTPTWEFSAEAGATFECRLVRGATVVSDWAACSSPRTYDLSGEPDGTYTFAVRARDVAGNTSSPTTSDYTLDTSTPVAPQIDASPGPAGNDVTPTWAFSAEAGATFECRLERGATVISDWTACTSPKTYDLTGRPDGTYTLSVRAVSQAGNRSAPATDAYDLDASAPGSPQIDSTPASPGNDATPSWAFTAEAGATIECRLERSATVISDWTACTSPRTIDLSGQPDATYTLSVRARDAAGNTGPATTSDYTLDTTAPGAPQVDSSPASPGNDPTPSWEFSAEAGASLECSLTRGGTVVTGWAACSSPKAFDLSGRPDGTYTFAVRARDAAGNTGPAATSDYALDTSGAAIQIDSGPGAIGRSRSPGWSFSSEAGASAECRLERGGTTVSDWSACSSPHSYDLSSEPDGDYSFSVWARDAAGNTGAPVSARYELDTVAPGAPSIDAPPGSPSKDRSPAWSFSGEAGAMLECRLASAANTISDWRACTSPRSYDLAGEADAVYALSVRATDAAGNTGPGASAGYELDTTPPAAPAITSRPLRQSDDASPTWSFTYEKGATAECGLKRGDTTIADRAPCKSPRTYGLTSRPDGTYTISLRATDAAGNGSKSRTDGYELRREDTDDGDAVRPDGDGPPQPRDGGGSGQPSDGSGPVPLSGGGPPGSASTLPPLTPQIDSGLAGAQAPAAADRERGPGGKNGSDKRARRPGGKMEGAKGGGPETLKRPDEDAKSLLDAIRDAARWLARNFDKTGFPLLLLLAVAGYLSVQNRLDGRDPKLALAPLHADRNLEFRPPPPPPGPGASPTLRPDLSP